MNTLKKINRKQQFFNNLKRRYKLDAMTELVEGALTKVLFDLAKEIPKSDRRYMEQHVGKLLFPNLGVKP